MSNPALTLVGGTDASIVADKPPIDRESARAAVDAGHLSLTQYVAWFGGGIFGGLPPSLAVLKQLDATNGAC